MPTLISIQLKEGGFASSQGHKPFIPCPLCPALHDSKAWMPLERAVQDPHPVPRMDPCTR